MNKNKFLAILPVLVLASLFVFTTCDMGGGNKTGTQEEPRNNGIFAAMPYIIQQPKDATYFVGDTVKELKVAGESTDGGEISYQWYSNTAFAVANGTAIDGATADTYLPAIDTSQTTKAVYYYAVITNTNPEADTGSETATVNSKVVKISVIADLTVGKTANATITVAELTKANRAQYVRGFGGMDVAWGKFPSMTMADMDNMFNPDKLGYNMLRIMILPDSTDIEETMENLVNNITYPDAERRFQYEFVKMVNKFRGYVLASPWSPPAVWKSNGVIEAIGKGYLLPEFYLSYADYLKSFADHMYRKGAPIYVISIQNEPNYDDDYDGCIWSGEQMRDFFKQAGQFTQGVKGYGGGKEIPRVLTMNGESANSTAINNAALNDKESQKYIDIIGRHVYGNALGRYALALDLGYEVWQTEHNLNSSSSFISDSTWNYVWKFMNDIDRSIRLNDESAFIWWAMKRFYSFIGDGEYGTTDGVILPRGYGMSHYAKFASEMYRTKFETTGTTLAGANLTTANFNSTTDGYDTVTVKATAFVSEDGNTISLILFTPTTILGANGVNMGTVKIELPAGFTAAGATAMRSTSTNRGTPVWEDVALDRDRNFAYIDLPAGNIYSVKFTK
jgi:O-glycosyl hydrolase